MCPCRGQSGESAFGDEFAFELGQCGEDPEDELSGCGCGVDRGTLPREDFEPNAALGQVVDDVNQRKGVGVFALTARGLESHAGLAPSEGASAIHAISDAIQHLVSAADPVRGTTVNVGTISGGTARNVVAGGARCEIDVRISDPEEMERLNHVFRQLAPRDARIRLDLAGGWNRPPMVLSEASLQLFDLANEVALQLQGPLAQLHVGGGSDANFIAALGYPVLCGIGATGDGAHARHEHILTADIADRTALLAGMLCQLGTTN